MTNNIVEELRKRTTGLVLLSDPPQYQKDGLCQQAADEIERLEKALTEIYEVWASSEWFEAETKEEHYLQRLVNEMSDIAGSALYPLKRKTGDE